ncbi:hypothetical protein [Demequina mangrovi]|uniref:Leucine rich repeat variant n=1 Tax=Demequina mangrovi TaxID=1043493 RepID=A0A1H6WVI5_9MICO|nr:hypothetical protein [Demequina mangrovi]SEJ16385.1 hypothetical protein SAMN05421637_1007 [Demequina mangrovi]
MADDGWSRAFMAASGVPMAGDRQDDALRALVNEARAEGLDRSRMAVLAAHREVEVREAVASRRDCPVALQATLAHDRRGSVRVALASCAGIAIGVAGELARDKDASVLKALARNSATPRQVLEALALHRRPDVARLARRALDGGSPAAGAVEQTATRPAFVRPSAHAEQSSPVGERRARALAPRPEVGRSGPRPAR